MVIFTTATVILFEKGKNWKEFAIPTVRTHILKFINSYAFNSECIK
jgi:hypothetical protein